MRRRAAANTLITCSLIAGALFAGSGPRSATQAMAETTTTITFDDLAAGTTLSNQYDSQGVNFEKGFINNGVYCYPVITQVSSQSAQSGDQVADTSCADGEFPDSSMWGILKNSAQSLSFYAGFFPTWSNPPASTTVTLTAYDANGTVVGSDTENVPANAGAHTLLQVSTSSPNIVQFGIQGPDSTNPSIAIDNLTFDNPGGIPPDFRIGSETQLGLAVQQGFSTDDVIDVRRLNGSSGGITFSTSGLPSGAHASFNPNPATGETTTMTISADPNATLPAAGSNPSFAVTGTPDSSAAGPSPQFISLGIQVEPNFVVAVPDAVQVPPCSQVQVKVGVNWTFSKPPVFTGPVTLAIKGLPADDQASFNPPTLTFDPGSYSAQSTLTLTGLSDYSAPDASVTVTGTSGQFTYSSSPFTVSRAKPSITSFTPGGGQTPQAQQGGTQVTVRGDGFCPGTELAFGNQKALVVSPIPTDNSHTGLQAIVPDLATTGPIYAIPAGGNLNSPGTVASTVDFNVDNYRDTNGFSFTNTGGYPGSFQDQVGVYSLDDLSEVFGYDQTHLSANPCWPIGDCSVSLPIPNPFALLFQVFANQLSDGQCFGFSLASQRLLHGDQRYSDFPLQPGKIYKTVWNLKGPDNPDGTTGASPDLAHFIHLMHVEQLSAEALRYWLNSAAANALAGNQTIIAGEVRSALAGGDHPLIEIRNGTEGHVVVAYNVESQEPNGDVAIDVYDPNQPYVTSEEEASGTNHQNTLADSRIIVHPNGHWIFQGAFADSPWHAGPGSIVVVPYGTVPVHPTMPISITGLINFVFGSAHASQVADGAGHTLLNPDGSINTDSATGIPDATEFARLTGVPKPGPDIFLFGKAGTYTQTIVGTKASTYGDSFLGNGLAASVSADSARGLTDKIFLLPNGAGVEFGQTGGPTVNKPRKTTVQLIASASDGSDRTAAIGTSMSSHGLGSVSFDSSRNSVDVAAGGQKTAFSVSLSWAGPHGYPQTFVAPNESLGAGETASLTPASWSNLEISSATLKIVHKNGAITTSTVRNTVHTANSYSIALKTAKKKSANALSIETKFKRLVKGSSAAITWQILRGTSLVGSHTKSIAVSKLHRGLLESSFGFKGAAGKHYIFKGTVTVFSPSKTSSFLSQTASKEKAFQG